jgi:Flp pilus assembly protein TadG
MTCVLEGNAIMNMCIWKRYLFESVRRLLASRRGGVLVEFGFVAPFVILLLTATLEVAVTLFVDATISGAAESAARDIRTGRIQEEDDPLDAFQTKLCGSLFGVVNCNEVVFDVRTFDDFESVEMTLEVDDEGNMTGGEFEPGDSGQITVVRISYRWQYLTPIVGHALAPDGSGGVLLLSTMAFQNEPYELGG